MDERPVGPILLGGAAWVSALLLSIVAILFQFPLCTVPFILGCPFAFLSTVVCAIGLVRASRHGGLALWTVPSLFTAIALGLNLAWWVVLSRTPEHLRH